MIVMSTLLFSLASGCFGETGEYDHILGVDVIMGPGFAPEKEGNGYGTSWDLASEISFLVFQDLVNLSSSGDVDAMKDYYIAHPELVEPRTKIIVNHGEGTSCTLGSVCLWYEDCSCNEDWPRFYQDFSGCGQPVENEKAIFSFFEQQAGNRFVWEKEIAWDIDEWFEKDSLEYYLGDASSGQILWIELHHAPCQDYTPPHL